MVSHLTIVTLAAAIAAAAATVDSTMKLFKVPGTHCLDGSLAPVRPVCAASRAAAVDRGVSFHWNALRCHLRRRMYSRGREVRYHHLTALPTAPSSQPSLHAPRTSSVLLSAVQERVVDPLDDLSRGWRGVLRRETVHSENEDVFGVIEEQCTDDRSDHYE